MKTKQGIREIMPDYLEQRHDCEALERAAREVDDAWDAWMMHEEGEGQERMERAIAGLRLVLNAR